MVARHANINNVLAMRLTRMDDARGRPFMVHLARCNRWPRGLDLGMMDSGNRGPDYCFSTFRESGSMDDAVTAHQRRGNRGGGVRPGGSGDGDGWGQRQGQAQWGQAAPQAQQQWGPAQPQTQWWPPSTAQFGQSTFPPASAAPAAQTPHRASHRASHKASHRPHRASHRPHRASQRRRSRSPLRHALPRMMAVGIPGTEVFERLNFWILQ